MSDVVGRGTIELVGDARKLKASIEDAKKSIRTLGEGQKDIGAKASQSIDRYIGRLQAQNQTIGKSTREVELFNLALRGASNEQLKSADAALRLGESHAKTQASIAALKGGFIALGAVAVTGLIAAAAAFDNLVKKAGDFQDLAETIGDSAENIASLAVAAAVGGKSMQEIGEFAVKLNKNLTGVDDEADKAGAALKAMGLNIDEFKMKSPVEQLEALAKALDKFAETKDKGNALEALARGGSQLLPFLKELAGETGRQVILTEEQIRLADQYADRQKALHTQIGLHASAIATEMLPAYNDLAGAFVDMLKGIGGVTEGAKGLGNSRDIQDFAESAAASVAFVIDTFDGLIRVIDITGKGIGAMAAAHDAAIRLHFREALQIAREYSADVDRILSRPTVQNLLEARRNERKAGGAAGAGTASPTETRPTLRFSGAVKTSGEESVTRALAAAQLALDLELIRKSSEATIAAYADAEKVIQARRAANLLDDQEYYATKAYYIRQNATEQERALQEEIARLQRETFTGKSAEKERIENEKKILDARAKLTRVRAGAITDLTVNDIQAQAALTKLAQSYVDAKVAADAYIESIDRRNRLELEAIGHGNKYRQFLEGRSQIEEKFIEKRQSLERDRRNEQITQDTFDIYLATAREAFEREVALYDQRSAAILAAEKDWVAGASEALANYADEAKNVARQTEEAFTHAFKSLEDALVELVTKGKLDFKSLVDSIIADIARMWIKQNILGPIAQSMGSGGGLTSFLSMLGIAAGAAAGAGGGTATTAGGMTSTGLKIPAGAKLGGYAEGTDWVPRTGLYQLHQGEAVLTARENQDGGRGGVTINIAQHFAPGTDRRTVNQAALNAGRAVAIASRRNG